VKALNEFQAVLIICSRKIVAQDGDGQKIFGTQNNEHGGGGFVVALLHGLSRQIRINKVGVEALAVRNFDFLDVHIGQVGGGGNVEGAR